MTWWLPQTRDNPLDRSSVSDEGPDYAERQSLARVDAYQAQMRADRQPALVVPVAAPTRVSSKPAARPAAQPGAKPVAGGSPKPTAVAKPRPTGPATAQVVTGPVVTAGPGRPSVTADKVTQASSGPGVPAVVVGDVVMVETPATPRYMNIGTYPGLGTLTWEVGGGFADAQDIEDIYGDDIGAWPWVIGKTLYDAALNIDRIGDWVLQEPGVPHVPSAQPGWDPIGAPAFTMVRPW